jgi:meiotic recombination protein SPO11
MILVDCDPHGLNIFYCYRYGSCRQRNPSKVTVTWWGIKTGHILDMENKLINNNDYRATKNMDAVIYSSQSSSSGTPISSTSCREPVSQLTARDRKLAVGTLKKVHDLLQDDEVAEGLRIELQRMLMLGVKTEIQWLDDSGSIAQWLDREMVVPLGLNYIHDI